MFGFSVRNAFRRKGIAFFAILGTALGCALMTVLLGISDGIDQRLSEAMNELSGGITVYSQDSPMGFRGGGGTPLPASYVEDIEALEHVQVVVPAVFAFVPKDVADFGDPMGVTLMGMDLDREREREEAGEGPIGAVVDGISVEGENQLSVGAIAHRQAEQAGLDTADIGSKFAVPTKEGPIELEVVGMFETGNNYFDSYLFCGIDTARKMAGLAGDELSTIMVETDDVDEVQAVAAAIEEMYEDSEVPVTARVATDIVEEIGETMSTFKGFLWVVSLVAAIAGGTTIFIVMLISVIERTKEFGILKASGWSNANIIGSVVLQSITVGLMGALAGLAIGYGAGQAIDQYLDAEIAIITVRLVVIIGVFGMAVGLVGGLYPAVRAARVSPIDSLRAL